LAMFGKNLAFWFLNSHRQDVKSKYQHAIVWR